MTNTFESGKTAPQSIELFTGAGGLGLATHLTGYHHRGLFEWNADACETLRANALEATVRGLSRWRGKINQGDVRDFSFNKFEGIDLVAGGPPCQPFSLGGKHGGMDDQRDMIPQFIRAVREARPRAFIMENVRGLTRKSFAQYLHYTILQLTYPDLVCKRGEDLEKHLGRLQQHHTSSPRKSGLSYNVVLDVLNAADYGVPQCRERLFVVGFRSDIDAHWSFPAATHSQQRLAYDQWVSGDYWMANNLPKPTAAPRITATQLALLKRIPPTTLPWRTIRQAILDLPAPFKDRDHKETIYNHRLQPGAKPYPGHTGSPIDSPSKTLKAGAHGVPGGENMIDHGNGSYRYLTIREAARIQTFPDAWHFRGAWSEAMRQLGNAVPVELAKVVAGSVANTLACTRH
ncbi:DNA cytosine methyltransferase [Xanthomonas nasturtii]|uniref:DNA cytosine methyltransferase n=1 Tax=Xanthomonas nasturtii TaxID=1843581 RepID=UPI0020131F73|nr:DNA cytosine methyltransferase [Xanthomonas nasturtii]MCL1561533.1 DNA cytosine methyltransferase [Xanthomonas nasturtii]